MRMDIQNKNVLEKYYVLASKYIAITGAILFPPFAINNFVQGRILISEVSTDVMTGSIAGNDETLLVEEECIPADETVCAIGTYDEKTNGLTGSRDRFGPNIIIYRGKADDVLSRLSKDISGFMNASIVMVTIAALIIIAAMFPHVFVPFLF